MWNFWLRAFTRFVLAALVNSLLALTCVFFFVERNDSAGERWFVFLLALGVLTIAPIVFALKRFLTDLLLGWATMRHAQKTMLVELRRAHMPTDDEYPIFDIGDYFRAVIASADSTPKQRLAAAQLWSKENAVWVHSIGLGLFHRAAAERALQDYVVSAPPEECAQEAGVKSRTPAPLTVSEE
ncbi:hypothetical protein PXK58_03210 [Phaeobacter gallaeciensis]|uniref:hypothetical protein n=1 Tax=Phaeobacter gallaeciensis TaxID=60890 RepID=UPI00238056A6|nr:hypothetical protein [Phaeobacter gallaeciensis]MDE4273309.1 hypothetical protein [Phaeobacter gallaeciensis]MDE4298549.1 hypothetical protein [Phaeobacter gallaeciensis]MDE5184240.1 hypothetical protein [Phaeobacter gallaeciensis]